MTDPPEQEVGTRGQQENDANTAPETNSGVDLASIPSLSELNSALADLTDKRFTNLLRAGLRYPLTRAKAFETTLIGALLLSLVVTSIPVNGYFIRVIEQAATGSDDPPDFPGLRSWREWIGLTIVGLKGLIIALLCFMIPLATLFDMLQVVSNSTGGLLSQVSTVYVQVLIAAILLYTYPAAIGNFVEQGRLIKGMSSIDDSSILRAPEYARSVLATATLFALTACAIWTTWTYWGIAVVVIAGPALFVCLSATSYMIGMSRRLMHSRIDFTEEEQSTYLGSDRPLGPEPEASLAVEADPIQEAVEENTEKDLYEVSTWEVRTRLDRIVARIVTSLRTDFWMWIAVYVVGLLVVTTVPWLDVLYRQPRLLLRISITILPSLLLTGYLWRRYAVTKIRFKTALVTFGLAASLTLVAQAVTGMYGYWNYNWNGETLIAGLLLTYFVYATSSELAKWLSVRLYAYRSEDFGAVVDGAVYGAIAGLAALSLNNFGFFSQVQVTPLIAGEISLNKLIHALIVEPDAATGQIYMRAITSIAHVIAAAFTGYYLGLAKFNRENARQIVAKGLLLAIFVLGTGEALNLAWYIGALPWVSQHVELSAMQVDVVAMSFVIPFLGGFCLLLLRKLSRYRTVYHDTISQSSSSETVERISSDAMDRQLKYLNELHEYGILSEEEWRQKRRQLLRGSE